ncbi:unnamed protein product [Microthlaspi erraticum]|uniref:DUF220 domain-containing protein n=1 Tax=Microthlaspi erraticum TaxID=1685480 RepID=A0A6D2JGJ8_9BRAS|nr:unnamed protein product [Microthlaspi erraticum]
MGASPGFGVWINQNTQQPKKAESKNVTFKSPLTHEERDDTKEQLQLWREAEKNKTWRDTPPKVKVATQEGICIMEIELIVGLPPQVAYDVLTNPDNQPYSRNIKKRGLLENKSRKVVSEDPPGQIVEVEKVVPVLWNLLSFPISLVFAENRKDLSGVYDKKKIMFMKMFEGHWKVEPIYVDSERLCKNMKPRTREEYRRCSGGQGKIASKVTMGGVFQPNSIFNVPPVSWFIRGITVKTTKTLLQDFLNLAAAIRGV